MKKIVLKMCEYHFIRKIPHWLIPGDKNCWLFFGEKQIAGAFAPATRNNLQFRNYHTNQNKR